MEVQTDGWPVGVNTHEEKELIANAARKVLSSGRTFENWILLERVKSITEKTLPGFKWSPLWDWQYAVLHRACRAAGAELRYVLPKKE